MATLRIEPPEIERRKTDRVQRVDGATAISDLVSSVLRNSIRYHISTGKSLKEFSFSLIQPAETYDPQQFRKTVTGYVKITMQVIAVSREGDQFVPDLLIEP
jgi:hypothetical protein